MSRLDLDFVRGLFPAFGRAELKGWAFLQNAGGSYACAPVIDRLKHFYEATKVQPYFDDPASRAAGAAMDAARNRLARWLGVPATELHFGPSTSANAYTLAQALGGYLRPGDEIIVTDQDHEANMGWLRRLADRGAVIREWRMDRGSADLDPPMLDRLLTDRTRVVAFPHCSNIVGTINPAQEICRRVREAGAISIVDGVSFCPHGLPDLSALGADVYLFSLYKVYGPHQGILHMRADLNAALPNQGHAFNESLPHLRFNPAGPDHAQVAASAGVIDYFEALARHHDIEAAAVAALLREQECELVAPLLGYLSEHHRVRLIGRVDPDSRAPTVSFTVDDAAPDAVARALAHRRLAVGHGDFYAWRVLEALGIDPHRGVVRISMVHYNSREETERLIGALDGILSDGTL